jgi:hypothetical protein
MRRIITLSLLALGITSGAAFADRGRDHRGAVVQRAQPRVYRNTAPRTYAQPRTYVQPRYRVQPRFNAQARVYTPRRTYTQRYSYGVRRPIYVERPVIRYHYYNYATPPAALVENYGPIEGYIWIAGEWQWNGYEWIWQPGHYEPDAAYDYDYGY